MINATQVKCPYCEYPTTVIIEVIDSQVYQCQNCLKDFQVVSDVNVYKMEE